MKRSVLTLLLVTVFCSCEVYAQAAQRQDPPWVNQVLKHGLVLTVPQTGVAVVPDVTYREVNGEPLRMDIYRPTSSTKASPLPVIVFVHGGIPPNLLHNPKEWLAYKDFGRLAASSGFVGVTFNYRAYEGHESLAADDLAAALKFVRQQAVNYGIDTSRINVALFSWGGRFLRPLLRGQQLIRSLAVYYGLVGSGDATSLTQARPIPTLVVRAGLDRPEINAGIDQFVRDALSSNLPVQVVNYPTGHHGFDIMDNTERSRQIIQETIRFFQQNN
ncbi:alpha/beta hydrolase [Spirosoma sp. BT702]|uniref:Alpha/beta hydrolase n=1 Tax=Spirosoma profusum TaxID=2771354 RepID=A0A927AW43_9BACT|nr:alpha/beta hydrolase [Spirosoma profusum]MBD2705492.1 alpha/beta hydrolase [Spirosoma profusum]